MKSFCKHLLKRRSILFWGTTTLGILLVGMVLGKLLLGILPAFLRELLPRLPYLNDNTEVIVEIAGEKLPQMQWFRQGTPVYEFQPELTLVGFISNADKSDQRVWRFNVAIIKKYEAAILRDDTRFEFLHASPSFLSILSRFFGADRGDRFKTQIWQLAGKNQQRITFIFSRLGKLLGQELQDQQLADRVLDNSFLKQEITDTVKREVFARIDWNAAVASIERNEHTATITALFKDNIDWTRVSREAVSGGANQALDEVGSYFIDPKYFSEMKGGKIIKVFSGIVSLIFDRQRSLERAKSGFQKGAWQQGWPMAQQELKRVFRTNNDQIMQHGSEVIKKAAQDVEFMDKVVGGFQSLAKNQRLIEHIKSRYGDKVAQALVQTFNQAALDLEIVSSIQNIIDDVQNLGVHWLEKFVLNDNRTGPNPLLLMALREGISHQPEPQIICFPGNGLRVNKHYIYQVTNRGKR